MTYGFVSPAKESVKMSLRVWYFVLSSFYIALLPHVCGCAYVCVCVTHQLICHEPNEEVTVLCSGLSK
jgi:hypothetical protein